MMSFGQECVALAAGGKQSFVVGVGMGQVMADSVDDPLGYLRSARPVEKHGGLCGDGAAERRILPAAGCDMFGSESHRWSMNRFPLPSNRGSEPSGACCTSIFRPNRSCSSLATRSG